MRTRRPVLLPPPRRARRPLPAWVAWVAVLGLVLLCCSTLPAVMRHERLSRDHGRLLDEISRQEDRLRALNLTLGAARRDAFTYDRALSELIHPPRR